MKNLLIAATGAAFVALGTVSEVQAATLGVSSRPALGTDDSVDWATLGPSFTSVPNPFTINSTGGKTLNVSQPDESFQRLDQNNGWAGNFAPGDALLFTNYNQGPITINFTSPIAGGGAQIQSNYSGPFIGTIEAFNSGGDSLGSFSFSGNSNNNADNSAKFIGLRSTAVDVDKLVFSTTNNDVGFAINQLDTSSTPVPEPLTILGSGMALGFGALMKRQYSRKCNKI